MFAFRAMIVLGVGNVEKLLANCKVREIIVGSGMLQEWLLNQVLVSLEGFLPSKTCDKGEFQIPRRV